MYRSKWKYGVEKPPENISKNKNVEKKLKIQNKQYTIRNYETVKDLTRRATKLDFKVHKNKLKTKFDETTKNYPKKV